MPKTLPQFDAYIADAPAFARPILQHLRAVVHAACPDCVEAIKWSHLTFLYQDKMLCSMAAFKAHVTFGFWHQEMEKLIAREMPKGKTGEAMGLLGRITKRDDLPSDATLRGYIVHAMKLTETGAPARPRAPGKKKPEAKTPPDLAARLKANKKAAATWETFAPSHRREYIEWITEAKRPETREHRLETTLEWLAEGKQRNWKYQNC
jgi:uncharacterized protein YdeI (YjbR/CyaY-like superfamily)